VQATLLDLGPSPVERPTQELDRQVQPEGE
jgi:hypothetical protein